MCFLRICMTFRFLLFHILPILLQCKWCECGKNAEFFFFFQKIKFSSYWEWWNFLVSKLRISTLSSKPCVHHYRQQMEWQRDKIRAKLNCRAEKFFVICKTDAFFYWLYTLCYVCVCFINIQRQSYKARQTALVTQWIHENRVFAYSIHFHRHTDNQKKNVKDTYLKCLPFSLLFFWFGWFSWYVWDEGDNTREKNETYKVLESLDFKHNTIGETYSTTWQERDRQIQRKREGDG